MENPMKASTATATTLIAIATSSMVEYRLRSKLNGMRHFWWQASGSVDLDHAALGRWRDFPSGWALRYYG